MTETTVRAFDTALRLANELDTRLLMLARNEWMATGDTRNADAATRTLVAMIAEINRLAIEATVTA